jgi:hypothetical protein
MWIEGQPLDTSLFEIFKVGIGPSSSHKVGLTLAASEFVFELSRRELKAGAR